MTVADPVRDGIPCMLLRGGTSKGAYFLAADLPGEPEERDALLLRVMGSPDPRQIDGLGGAHPLTSKVAIVSTATDDAADIDYLFLQIGIDEPVVGDAQTCGNLLAGVGPFAIERGLVRAEPTSTTVRIRLLNTGDIATAVFATPDGRVDYDGDAAIDGVPGRACAVELDVASAPGRSLLPTGNVVDEIAGHRATLVDNGMPVVLLDAEEFGVRGDEGPHDLEARADLVADIDALRLAAAPLFGIADPAAATVPKMFLLSPPRGDGDVATRAFIPRRVHSSIGVLMAASVAAGIRIPGTLGARLARPGRPDAPALIEHPAGIFAADVRVEQNADGSWHAASRTLRTARKIFDGRVFPRPRL